VLPKTEDPPRAHRAADGPEPAPLLTVWELTLQCDQPCNHCGSRAGKPRGRELTTIEVLDTAKRLVALGCREFVFIGGEAYLRDDLAEIVAGVTALGVRAQLQTGGRAFHEGRAKVLADAGLFAVGVSIDGLEATHDLQRGNRGSHAAAIRALDVSAAVGLLTTVNTQINRLNLGELRAVAEDLQRRGVVAWQPGLTVPMGRAADRPEWLIEPWQIVEVIDVLAEIQLEAAKRYTGGRPFDVVTGNTIGYYGPHEHILRSHPGGTETHWSGCGAGEFVIGIESDGTVKGCPSLATEAYAGGNLLETAIERLWHEKGQLHFTRERTTDELWGHCKDCYYAAACGAGCSWMTDALFGRRGNNPFCYHRVKQLEKRGIRERLVPIERAPQRPYDRGRFALEEIAADAPSEASSETLRRRLPLM
jgi:radical SAM protein with 4Fe4S-binding SPASM domain